MKHPIFQITVLLMVISPAWLGGCAAPPPPVSPYLQADAGRSQRLMTLAAREAGGINNPDRRLTRQLNLADLQIDRGWVDDARNTLAAARTTLGSQEAARLTYHARISGWVSISELSRRIHDGPTAAVATEAALRELDKIEDQGKRCEFVMGLANELQYIKGKPAAAALLAAAGPWTRSIDNLAAKRQALIAFASALFNLDDFDAGQKMLGQDADAAWRSDVLAGMAQVTPVQQAEAAAVRSFLPMPAEAASSPAAQPFYGKSLDFDAVFKNQKISNTTKD